jgi:uncharacterized lipoprotein YmbA
MRIVLILLAALLVSSCGSGTPPKFYRLVVSPPAGAAGKTAIEAPITLAAVHIPPSLDRAELVRQTGQTEVAVDSQQRWAAPLADMIRDVLSQDLAARLPPGKVIPPDAPAAPGMRKIVVTIVAFGPDQRQEMHLAGDWSLLNEGAANPSLRREFALTLASSAADGAEQAAGMSRSLGQLADAIAAALSEEGGG